MSIAKDEALRSVTEMERGGIMKQEYIPTDSEVEIALGAEAMSEPKIYRKKPVEVQAMQILTPTDVHTSSCWMENNRYPYLQGDATHPETLRYPNQLPSDETKPDKGHYIAPDTGNLVIRTLEGDMQVSRGDYVIRGVNGEFYPCKSDVFAKTYEEVQQMDEAEKMFPHTSEDISDKFYSEFDMRDAYVAGRTAPVTEAEIEAAARELWRSAFYRRARPSGTVQDFDDLTEKDRHHLTHAAQAMLSAARKQVSDE